MKIVLDTNDLLATLPSKSPYHMIWSNIALKKQYNYYLDNETEFLNKYQGKQLVISNDLQVTPFDTIAEAYQYGADTYGLGNFLLQECTYEATHTVHQINVRLVG